MQSHLKCYCILPQSNSCKNVVYNYVHVLLRSVINFYWKKYLYPIEKVTDLRNVFFLRYSVSSTH